MIGIRYILPTVAIGLLMLARGAAAESESRWVVEDVLRSRLVSAVSIAPAQEDVLWLGWQVALDPGWKTYWRYPGETGKAPRFTVLEARNLRTFDVHYPPPDRFTLGGIDGFGYRDALMLPISLKPRASGADMFMRLRVDFMACKDVCIPFEAVYELTLPAARMSAAPTAHAEAIAAARARLPDPTGGDGVRLTIESIGLSGPAGHRRLIAEVAADVALFDADFFVEPGMDYMIGALDRSLRDDGRRVRFSLAIEPMDNTAPPLKSKRLRVTVVDGHGHAIDRWLDFSTSPPRILTGGPGQGMP